jgi:SAM-dependent methyltransferase
MDVVYCSHFLEHLTQEQSTFVLQESQRILKKNGILRVVVPDLENICREYLRVLDLVSADKKYAEKYDWIIVELLDQLVRVNRGGQMGKMFFQIASTKNNQLAEYILSRTGDDLLKESKPKPRKITYDKIKNKILYLYLKSIRFLIPKNLRDLIFVDTSVGEKHQWMYDKYSMEQKLLELGFLNISIKSYKESNIPDFNSYLLDMEEDGAPYKGESSLYMEAIK